MNSGSTRADARASEEPRRPRRRNAYQGLAADYSRPDRVSPPCARQLIERAEAINRRMEPALPALSRDYGAAEVERENREWWPAHCEALRQGRADLLAGEYRDELAYLCQDGPFYGRDAGTTIERSWWKLLSQPGVTMCWPIVMFHGEVVYFEWNCVDDETHETTAEGSVTFLRRGHRGGVYLKTEQLTFYRDVHERFFCEAAE